MGSDYPYGAGYYPLLERREHWSRDLAAMRSCGMNVVRTAELFNTWDRIEAESGVYRFAFLDDFFEECAGLGMKIILGSGTASPPHWLHARYPDIHIVDASGQPYPINAAYSWACIDHPAYIEAAERYLSTVVERYRGHAALYAYQIHNEIGFPFMSSESGAMRTFCYNAHSIRAFGRWIEGRYRTIEMLNEAWTWSATNTVYRSFDEVEPPRIKPEGWSSVTRWLDWRLFWMDRFVRFVAWQNEIIKALDRDHPTTTNIFYMKSQDPFGSMMGLDQFSMAEVVDIISYDLYPGSGDKLEARSEFSSLFLDHARSVSRPIGKPYWLIELESGPINGWMLGPHRATGGADILRNAFEAVGHDAKMIHYMGWKEWDFQPLRWGGIVDLDGNPTDRTESSAEIGRFLSRHGDFLLNAATGKGEVALLCSKENQIILSGVSQEGFLLQAIRGAYRIYTEMGFTVDFITPELLRSGYADDYAVIHMPALFHLDRATAAAAARYVRKGGFLVGTAQGGVVGERGWYNRGLPCGDLAETFGVRVVGVESGVTPSLTYRGRNYTGHWHKENVSVTSVQGECEERGAAIVARFFDDRPAAVRNLVGRGAALYVATHFDAAYVEGAKDLAFDLLRDLLAERGIAPALTVEYANRCEREVDIHRLIGDDREMLLCTHFVPRARRSGFFIDGKRAIRVNLRRVAATTSITDMFTGEAIPFAHDDGVIRFEYTLQRDRVAAFMVR